MLLDFEVCFFFNIILKLDKMPQCIVPVAQCLTMYENIFECLDVFFSTTQMIVLWVLSRHSQKRILAKISVKVWWPASSWYLSSRGRWAVGGMVSIPFYSYTLFHVTRSRTPNGVYWSHEVKCNPFPCCWNYYCLQWRWGQLGLVQYWVLCMALLFAISQLWRINLTMKSCSLVRT